MPFNYLNQKQSCHIASAIWAELVPIQMHFVLWYCPVYNLCSCNLKANPGVSIES